MRVKITLACTECKQRNYDTVKTRRTIPTVSKRTSIVLSAGSTPYTERHAKGSPH